MIPEGTEVELNFIYKEEARSMIVEKRDASPRVIYIPAILDKYVPIPESEMEDVEIVYKANDGITVFKPVKLELRKYNENYIYIVTCDSNVERQNRREAFRVFIGESITLNVSTKDGKEQKCPGVLKDISVGGMGIISGNNLEDADTISIVYEVWEGYQVLLTGQVVSSVELDGRRGYLYGCKFNERSEVISKFTVKRQIKNRMSAMGLSTSKDTTNENKAKR
jgi:c-di-GMP-binding flagellar brake protein YcgR